MIPEISIDYKETTNFALVCPETLKVIGDSIIDKTQVGSIQVKYKFDNILPPIDDYDEDEQLYNAIMEKSLASKYQNYSIPMYKLDNKSLTIITIPHITNQIALNLIAKALAELDFDKFIMLAPCMLNNNQSLNKFVYGLNDESFMNIPAIRPPHFITGIGGSLSSKLYLAKRKFICLVLNAEGQPGYERIDNDSLVDASTVLAKFLYLNKLFLKAVSKVRKLDYSSSGMYI